MGAAAQPRNCHRQISTRLYSFYERFVLANRDDREALNAVDALIFSMAAAELKVFDEDSRKNRIHIDVKNGGDWITRELRVALEQAVIEREQNITFDPNAV